MKTIINRLRKMVLRTASVIESKETGCFLTDFQQNLLPGEKVYFGKYFFIERKENT